MLDRGKRRKLLLIDTIVYFAAFAAALVIRYSYLADTLIQMMHLNNSAYILFATVSFAAIIITYLYGVAHNTFSFSGDILNRIIRVFKNHFIILALSSLFLFANHRILDVSRFIIMIMYPLSVTADIILREIYYRRLKKKGYFARKKYSYLLISPTEKADHVKKLLFEGSDGIMSISEVLDIDGEPALPSGCSEKEVLIFAPGKRDKAERWAGFFSDKGMGVQLIIDSAGIPSGHGALRQTGPFETLQLGISDRRANVLGVMFTPCMIDTAVILLKDNAKKLVGKYVCFSNVHTSVMAREDDQYRDILNGAAYVFADGKPVAEAIKKMSNVPSERVAGPDFMGRFFAATEDKSLSHFFYGSTDATLEGLKKNLSEKYPGLDIKGFYSPPFKELSDKEDEEIIDMLNSSGADIIWVGLGAPRQEKWMAEHKDKINALMLGVGAGFDFHGGTVKRAPGFMQRIGLEWLYRLFQDPGRLFSRYLKTNLKFAVYFFLRKNR